VAGEVDDGGQRVGYAFDGRVRDEKGRGVLDRPGRVTPVGGDTRRWHGTGEQPRGPTGVDG
jgi:hypothetical protein